jgi:hypothetical protein
MRREASAPRWAKPAGMRIMLADLEMDALAVALEQMRGATSATRRPSSH